MSDLIDQSMHAVPMRRLVYAWEGEVEGLHARIKGLETERDKLRKALERACEGLEYAGHGSDDPEVCPACKVYDDIRAVLAKPPVEEGK